MFTDKITVWLEEKNANNDDSPALNDTANLTSLTITGATLKTEFNEDITAYVATVDYHVTNEVTVTATAVKHSTASFASTNVTLVVVSAKEQIKSLIIKVIAEDGITTKTYTVNVVMLAEDNYNPLSSNANLTSLSVTNATLTTTFDPNITSYVATVPYQSTGVLVTAIAVQTPNSTLNSTNVLSATVDKDNQIKVLTITVTAEDGITTKTYTVNVVMLAEDNYNPLSSNANLTSLTVTNATLTTTFDPNITSYVATVPYQSTGVLVTAIAVQTPNSTLNSTNVLSATVDKDNQIKVLTITVTAEDGITTKTYTVSVVMLAQTPNPLSSNAKLTGLLVNNTTDGTTTTANINPCFDPDITSYLLQVTYQSANPVTITATPFLPTNATEDDQNVNNVVISQTNPVDTIVIKIIAENGVTVIVYTIHVLLVDVPTTPQIWSGNRASAFSGGTGTSSSPYEIKAGDELAYLADLINAGNSTYNNSNVYYTLTEDIILNDTSNINNWATQPPANSWTPIGTATNGFIANFDGSNYIIEGLYINKNESNIGLFGVVGGSVKGGIVKNVMVRDSFIRGENFIGGVIGLIGANNASLQQYLRFNSSLDVSPLSIIETWVRIENVTNYATVVGTGNYIGGVAGALVATETVQVINCTNNGSVTGIGNVGGLVGFTRATNLVEILNCQNSGSIHGENAPEYIGEYIFKERAFGGTGGVIGTIICGDAFESGKGFIDVNNCVNTGSINGKDYTGGIVGYSILLGGYDPILNSYNSGNVTGDNYVGGIAGFASAPGNFGLVPDWILNCYNTATVTGLDIVGGISGGVGATYHVTNCYNTGQVVASSPSASNVGAIVGQGRVTYDGQASEVLYCYYRSDSGLNIVGDTNILISYSTSFNNSTGFLTTTISGNNNLLSALNYWVNSIGQDYGTVTLVSGDKYLRWTDTPLPIFIPSLAVPSM